MEELDIQMSRFVLVKMETLVRISNGKIRKRPNETGYAIVAGRTHESLQKVRTFDPPP